MGIQTVSSCIFLAVLGVSAAFQIAEHFPMAECFIFFLVQEIAVLYLRELLPPSSVSGRQIKTDMKVSLNSRPKKS